MESNTKQPELLAIIGPTASGKSELALKIAQSFPVEIIAADSRTLYKGLDIGTAKPSKRDQEIAPHWGLDLINPGESFSVHSFQKYANEKINEIRKRGKLPILVGGTGLYIDAVLYKFELTVPISQERQVLEEMTVEELQALIAKRELALPVNNKNKLHLIRTLERNGQSGKRSKLSPGILIVGLMPDEEILKKRIHKRAEKMFNSRLTQETKQAMAEYGERATIKCGIIYKYVVGLINGDYSEQTATTEFQRSDWQYARRQRTWFKRNKDIIWFKDIDSAYSYISNMLNK